MVNNRTTGSGPKGVVALAKCKVAAYVPRKCTLEFHMMVHPPFAGPSTGAVFSISAMQSSNTLAIDERRSTRILAEARGALTNIHIVLRAGLHPCSLVRLRELLPLIRLDLSANGTVRKGVKTVAYNARSKRESGHVPCSQVGLGSHNNTGDVI